jgi:hypothetical protein
VKHGQSPFGASFARLTAFSKAIFTFSSLVDAADVQPPTAFERNNCCKSMWKIFVNGARTTYFGMLQFIHYPCNVKTSWLEIRVKTPPLALRQVAGIPRD